MADKTHANHRNRMRARYERAGIKAFNDCEILEMLLFYTIPRCNTNPIAHELLDCFGSLDAVLEAPVEALCAVKSIGRQTALFLNFVGGSFERYESVRGSNRTQLKSAEQVAVHLEKRIRNDIEESLYIMILDKNHYLKLTLRLANGDENEVEAYIRQIAELCMSLEGKYYILAHNHPTGIALPSKADVRNSLITENALTAMGFFMTDNLIFSNGDYVSLAQSRMLLRQMSRSQIATALTDGQSE